MVEDLEVNVAMTNQSFVEAGGKEVFPDLEIVGTVIGKLDKGENSAWFHNKRRVDVLISHSAKNLYATHIFKVEYLFRPNEFHGEELYGVIGTAYKSKK